MAKTSDARTRGPGGAATASPELTPDERSLLEDLFAVIAEHADGSPDLVDRESVARAFAFACGHHADQRRRPG